MLLGTNFTAIPFARASWQCFRVAGFAKMDDSKSRYELCYYITGHGLGHATRSLEVIRILLSSNRFVVHIVTQVKSDFFVSNLNEFDSTMFSYSCRALDTGAHQQDVFVVDMVQSLAQYCSTIHQNRQRLLDYEVQWLKDKHITLVLVDATPLGCEAGRLAGATTVVVSNFTWDFCYKEMLREVSAQDVLTPQLLEQYQSMVHQCALDSSACSYYLQLPGATPLPAPFDQSKLVHGPLLARGVRNANLRAELNIPSDARILLLGFGGHSAAWQLQDSFLPSGWVCLVLGKLGLDFSHVDLSVCAFNHTLLCVLYYRRCERRGYAIVSVPYISPRRVCA